MRILLLLLTQKSPAGRALILNIRLKKEEHEARPACSNGSPVRLLVISFLPLEAKASPKDKMQYAMWTNLVKQKLSGVHAVIPAHSEAELDKESVLERVTRFERDQI
jgi:hypothetical protein